MSSPDESPGKDNQVPLLPFINWMTLGNAFLLPRPQLSQLEGGIEKFQA